MKHTKGYFILFLIFPPILYAQNGSLKKQRGENEFEYEGCGCKANVNLYIYDGLNTLGEPGNWGGNIVSGARNKFDDGAITVANLNDTDGDETIDIDDQVVTASDFGEDECDLMKLNIVPTGNSSGNCMVTLTYEGDIAFYNSYTKGTQITNLEFPLKDASGESNITTLFVEARAVSTAMRDIKIYAKIDNEIKDKVAATAIWVEKKNIYSDEDSKIEDPDPALLTGLDQPVLVNVINNDARAKDLTRYGFGSFQEINSPPYTINEDLLNGGRILFEFELKPAAILSEISKFNITLDGARRQDSSTGFRYVYNKYLPEPTINIPKLEKKKDFANDDPKDNNPDDSWLYGDIIDEDKNPLILYSFDGPSTARSSYADSDGNLQGIEAYRFRHVTFEEYFRVSFNQVNELEGNVLSGSRVSNKHFWSIDYATYAKDTKVADANKYNIGYHYAEFVATPGDKIITYPTCYLETSGNGSINITSNNLPTDRELYAISYSEIGGKHFDVKRKKHENNNKWDQIGSSNIDATGPWVYTDAEITIEMANDSDIPFAQDNIFYFWVIQTSDTIINKLNY